MKGLHPVTSQDIDTVRAKGKEAFGSMTQSKNRQIRQETGTTIQTRQKKIFDNEKRKSRNTSPIVQEVQNEQGKSVVKRVAKTAGKETLEMGKGIFQEVKKIGKEVMGIGVKNEKD